MSKYACEGECYPGWVACIDDDATNDWLVKTFSGRVSTNYLRIGYTESAGGSVVAPDECDFSNPNFFTKWSVGEPNSRNADCSVMNVHTDPIGYWQDSACTSKFQCLCQTYAASPAPTLCSNDQSWFKAGDPSKNCDWIGSFASQRCADRIGEDGRLAFEACSLSCGCTRLPTMQPSEKRPSFPPNTLSPTIGISAPTTWAPSLISPRPSILPTTPIPTLAPSTTKPTAEPTDKPVYYGQFLHDNHDSETFQYVCLTWAILSSILSLLMLRIVYENIMQGTEEGSQYSYFKYYGNCLHIVFSQYDYVGDTIYISFERFSTPILFIIASIAYFMPLALFLYWYRGMIFQHLRNILLSTKEKIVLLQFDEYHDCNNIILTVGSIIVIFPVVLVTRVFFYFATLLIVVSIHLERIPVIAEAFFQSANMECDEKDYKDMSKFSSLTEYIFEDAVIFSVAIVDVFLKVKQDWRTESPISNYFILEMTATAWTMITGLFPYFFFWVRSGSTRDAWERIPSKINYTPEHHGSVYETTKNVCYFLGLSKHVIGVRDNIQMSQAHRYQQANGQRSPQP